MNIYIEILMQIAAYLETIDNDKARELIKEINAVIL